MGLRALWASAEMANFLAHSALEGEFKVRDQYQGIDEEIRMAWCGAVAFHDLSFARAAHDLDRMRAFHPVAYVVQYAAFVAAGIAP
jgi:hypothetical protein